MKRFNWVLEDIILNVAHLFMKPPLFLVSLIERYIFKERNREYLWIAQYMYSQNEKVWGLVRARILSKEKGLKALSKISGALLWSLRGLVLVEKRILSRQFQRRRLWFREHACMITGHLWKDRKCSLCGKEY